MQFTYEELALLNRMVSIALMSGQIEFDEISESIHKKISNKIMEQNQYAEER